MLHGNPLLTNLPFHRPTAKNDYITDAQHYCQQYYTQSSKPSLPQLQHGQSVTMYNHNTYTWQPVTMCYILLDPTCSLQITEEVIVETGVIYLLFPQQHLLVSLLHIHIHESYQHTILIRLQLPQLVVMIVVKLIYKRQMDQLTMNIVSLNLNQHLYINRDIGDKGYLLELTKGPYL